MRPIGKFKYGADIFFIVIFFLIRNPPISEVTTLRRNAGNTLATSLFYYFNLAGIVIVGVRELAAVSSIS